MFTRAEARHFKCLRRVDVMLRPFNILIGPNASGKSTFLDIWQFLADALEHDIEEAVRRRANALRELSWRLPKESPGFELGLEADIPPTIETRFRRVRYEVRVGLDPEEGIVVSAENLWLLNPAAKAQTQPAARPLFPLDAEDTPIVRSPRARKPKAMDFHLVVRKVETSGNDYFRSESTGWNISFRLSPKRLALSGVPEDEKRFPVALWFRGFLRRGIHMLHLNSRLMRRPAPPDLTRTFQPDGSNLPILVRWLQEEHPQRFAWWVDHLRTVLDDMRTIEVHQRPEDHALYLVVQYANGIGVPSWMLSDGTLRLMALTLIAYLPLTDQVFLIEEPENGIHPRAIEAVYQSLRSVYTGQIFLATHSPLFMALAKPEDLLIFGKTEQGASDIVRGNEHPELQSWRSQPTLDVLFAAGVLE